MKQKKLNKYTLLIGLIILAAFIFIAFHYNAEDSGKGLNDKNYEIELTANKIIKTDFFELIIPEDWTHKFGGYGNEGDPYGVLITGEEIINYEYGDFASKYTKGDNKYEVEQKTINRFQVNIARSTKGEVGIFVPQQNEMKSSLTFYLDKSVANNLENIINIISVIKFK